MSDLVYRMDAATDPTTVNSTGTAAANITSTPAGFAVTATSGGAGQDMSLVGSAIFKRTGLTALRITTASGVSAILRLPFHTTGGGRQMAVEFYHGATALPTVGVVIAMPQTAGGVGPRILLETNGAVSLQDAAGATQGTTVAGAWAINRRNRIALVMDNTGGSAAGTATLHVYNDDGTTPTGTIGPLSAKDFGAAAITDMDIGAPTSTAQVWVHWFEDVQMGNGRTTEFGPYLTNNPPTVSVGSDFTVDPNLVDTFTLTATAADSDGTIVSYVWDDLGAGATLAGSGATRTPPVVRSVAGSTRAYRCTVQDNSGAFANATVNVTFLPHTRWLKTSGGLATLRRNV